MSDFDSQAGRAMPVDPDVDAAQSESDDDDVAAAVRDLAVLVADVDEIEPVLVQIAHFAVAAIPGAEGAGATLVREHPGAELAVSAWASTDPFVREIDQLQYEICHEGPCLTAMQTGRTQVSGSLGSDDRWPRFGGRVARLAVHSALSLPLISRARTVGALNVYAHSRDAFTEYALRLAEQFAGPAAVAAGNLRALHVAQQRASHLQVALTSRAVIDQAIGILRGRSGGTSEEAMDRLVRLSQTEKVKLSVIAQQIVDDAVRRAHARTQPRDEFPRS